MTEERAPAQIPDWEAPSRPVLTGREVGYLAALELAIYAFLFVLGAVVGGPGLGVTLILFFIAGLAISLGTSGRRALLSAGARRPQPNEMVRVRNLVAGMARDLKVTEPHLRMCDDDAPNAMVCRAGGPVITVTSGIEALSRTELEAVLAHCLARLNGKGLWVANLVAELVFLAAPFRPMVGFDDDIKAAAITRYPPGLISAIQRAGDKRGRHAPLWFSSDGPWHRPRAERIEQLGDL